MNKNKRLLLVLFLALLALPLAGCDAPKQNSGNLFSERAKTLHLAGDVTPEFELSLNRTVKEELAKPEPVGASGQTGEKQSRKVREVGAYSRAFGRMSYSYNRTLIQAMKEPAVIEMVRFDARSITDVLRIPLDALNEKDGASILSRGYVDQETYDLLLKTKARLLTDKPQTLSNGS